MITKSQAEALTSLAVAIRPHGARQWDAAGVMAAILKVRHLHLADVAMAVIRAADDRALETPAPIGNPKARCWVDKKPDHPRPLEPYDVAQVCGVCEKRESVCRAIPKSVSGHTFVRKVDVLAERRPAPKEQA